MNQFLFDRMDNGKEEAIKDSDLSWVKSGLLDDTELEPPQEKTRKIEVARVHHLETRALKFLNQISATVASPMTEFSIYRSEYPRTGWSEYAEVSPRR